MASFSKSDIDAALSAYQEGVNIGQDYVQVTLPFERDSVEAYAFLKGMAHGMMFPGSNLCFEGQPNVNKKRGLPQNLRDEKES